MNINVHIRIYVCNVGINRPTPIQVQAIPALLSGRDIIGTIYCGCIKYIFNIIYAHVNDNIQYAFNRHSIHRLWQDFNFCLAINNVRPGGRNELSTGSR